MRFLITNFIPVAVYIIIVARSEALKDLEEGLKLLKSVLSRVIYNSVKVQNTCFEV